MPTGIKKNNSASAGLLGGINTVNVDKTTGVKSKIFTTDIRSNSDMGDVFASNNLYNRNAIQWYDKFNRFGCIDPYNSVSNTKEYLFFTKPDLHICEPGSLNLNPELSGSSFFVELLNRYPNVIKQLQRSVSHEQTAGYHPFMNILSNSVKNTLDMPEISSDDIDTSSTIYGTSITYRGDGFSSDEAYEFSLEFEDSRYLEIYHLFKAYDEYERLKRVGMITPPNVNNAPVYNVNGMNLSYNRYLEYKELHDQFAVYKIVTDEDYETILYYAYFCGVYPKNVPRDTFSEIRTDNGLRYSVSFKAQFVDDMKPYILLNLNNIVNSTMVLNTTPTYLDIYNSDKKRVDGSWAVAPWIVRKHQSAYQQWLGPNSMNYDYKLKWRIK